jgi:hypothetical protein
VIESTNTYIIRNVAPAHHQDTFKSLVEEQAIMLNSVKTKSNEGFKQSLESQSSLVKTLLQEVHQV